MRAGSSSSGIRDDLFRRCERDMLTTIWLADEVCRTSADNGTGRGGTRIARWRAAHLEAQPREPAHLLHSFGALGRRRCRLADPS